MFSDLIRVLGYLNMIVALVFLFVGPVMISMAAHHAQRQEQRRSQPLQSIGTHS